MSFVEAWTEFREAVNALIAEGDAAVAGGHGYKAAHKRMRKKSLEVGKMLVELRKASVAASGGDTSEAT